MKVHKKENILVVGPSWIGDMVMAQSLFITLKKHDPYCSIQVLAPKWSRALLSRMPEVDASLDLPFHHGQLAPIKRLSFARSIKDKNFTRSIVLPNSWKSALIPFWAGIPKRRGFLGELRYGLINELKPLDKSVLSQTVQRYVALGINDGIKFPFQIPYPSLKVDSENLQLLIQSLNIPQSSGLAGLIPGAAYGPAKQWPVEHFAALAGQLCNLGFQVLIFGSSHDHYLGEQIKSQAGDKPINLCGRTSLTDVIDLFASTDFIVSNDSGLMHVAAAVGCSIVAIYGSSSPAYTPPLTSRAFILQSKLECSPCFKRKCPYRHYRCLQEIYPDQAAAIIRDWYQNQGQELTSDYWRDN